MARNRDACKYGVARVISRGFLGQYFQCKPKPVTIAAARQYIAPLVIPAPTVNAPKGGGGCCAGSGSGDYKNTAITTIVNANRTAQYSNGRAALGKPVPASLSNSVEALRDEYNANSTSNNNGYFLLAFIVLGVVAYRASK